MPRKEEFPSHIDPQLVLAANAAIAAGKEIMSVYQTSFEVELKSDESPLTLADERANKVIQAYLEPTGIPVISEESEAVDYSLRRRWTQLWMVDPLDGTKEFVKRNGEFTVNIALISEGRPRQGVVFLPVNRTLYMADVEHSQSLKLELIDFKSIESSDFKRAHQLSGKKPVAGICRVVASRSHLNQDTQDFISKKEAEGQRVLVVSRGSSLKFCMLAEGLADVYPRFAPTMEWDTAAGQAICEAVGIMVFSKETAGPLVYNKPQLLNPHFVAGEA
jgi:3'(2'), 5'-bisphosphate nucleotidase